VVDSDDGTVLWRLRGLGKGSVIRLGSQVIAVSDRGKLHLYSIANSSALEEYGTYEAFDARTWTAPSYSRGVLYLRSSSSSEWLALDLGTQPTGPPQRTANLEIQGEDSEPAAQEAVSVRTARPGQTDEEKPLNLDGLLDRHRTAMGPPSSLGPLAFELTGTLATNGLSTPVTWTSDGAGTIHRSRRESPFSESEPIEEQVVAAKGTAIYHGSSERRPMAQEQIDSLNLEGRLLHPIIPELSTQHMRYRGLQSFDTGEGLLVEVQPPEASKERWFLDPETFLPLALVTERWVWGRVREMRYYFGDWRDLDGRKVPFLIEDEFSSFHRALQVERVEFETPPGAASAEP